MKYSSSIQNIYRGAKCEGTLKTSIIHAYISKILKQSSIGTQAFQEKESKDAEILCHIVAS